MNRSGESEAHAHTQAHARAARLLVAAEAGFASETERLACSVELASCLAIAARAVEGFVDRRRRLWLGRLCTDPSGQAFVSAMADRVHRSRDPRRVAEVVRSLGKVLGAPTFLPVAARLPLELAIRAPIPSPLVAGGVRTAVRLASAGLVHDADEASTRRLVGARATEHTAVNANLVGEVVLGETEARARHAAYRTLLRTTAARAVSIKLSSIASQIALPGFEATIAILTPRLGTLYEEAKARAPAVVVNLDMEAYDDLELTLELHRRLSNDPAFRDLTTGVVLQAYIPDAHARYESLLALAHARAARGWAPLRVRIVKGANLSMERHLAELRTHPLPIYASKAETDASWLALVTRATERENARVLQVGVASHNLFDLAFAAVRRREERCEADVELEMLEGMADPLRRVLAELAGPVLVYAPIVAPSELDAAIAYLVRRLEEATAPGHFLRASFDMEPGDDAYELEERRFRASMAARTDIATQSLRDRPRFEGRLALDTPFVNEPDSDWARARERTPLLEAVATLEKATASPGGAEDEVCSIVDGTVWDGTREAGRDPSRPGLVPYEVLHAGRGVVDRALEAATRSRWNEVSARERAERLADVASALRVARTRLVATMVLDGGKRIDESDAEVSEAIDFAEYYARAALLLDADRHVSARPLGTVVVASPWNFPLAIGAGGVFAALAAGNSVVLKPSPKTPLVARELVRLVHAAGVPSDALALLVIDDTMAAELVRDERTSAVVLTGSSRTARAIATLRPRMPLFAETGGKNTMVITATADRDLAIRDAVGSAFRHAGQKCSATSLLICEREVYDDRGFLDRLVDATTSLAVGSAWDPSNVVTPLIEPPPRGSPLARALAGLEPGETWLVPPRRDADNPALYTPSIKMGVSAFGFTHQTELFGPVLALVRAETFAHALAIADGTPYGLTGAIHALDPREQEQWLAHVEVGNAYVNRGTTGAIVGRQPFGGTKASCFGPGAKAGGPAYVRQLVRLTDAEPETRHAFPNAATRRWLAIAAQVLDAPGLTRLQTIAEADAAVFEVEFAYPAPTSAPAMATQRNLLMHVPRRATGLVIRTGDRPFHVLRELVAASVVGAEPNVVHLGTCVEPWVTRLSNRLVLLPSEARSLDHRLAGTRLRALRVLGDSACDRDGHRDGHRDEDALAGAAARHDIRLLDRAPLESSSATLAYWMEERSVTVEDHRYGQPLPEGLRAHVGRPPP